MSEEAVVELEPELQSLVAKLDGLTLLQAAWLAARGRLPRAALVAGAGPVFRRAARVVSPT